MKIWFLILNIVLLSNILIYSQTNELTGNVYGNVVDIETKQPLPFVNVWIENTSYGTTTDTTGYFEIKNIPIGKYSFSASMVGYKQLTLSDIIVVTKRSSIINFELQVDIKALDEVTVRPSFFSKNNTFSISSINSIDNQEIRKTPGIPDIFRRLQSVAGIGKATDFSPSLIVRGGDPEENLTLIENIEIYSPFHFSNLGGTAMADGMSIIEPKLVQKVDIATGGFSSKYGDRLSSVTSISLIEPDKNHFNGNLSMDMGGFSSAFSGPLGKKSTWLVAGRRGMWDMFMKMQGKDYHPKTLDLHAKYTFEPNPEHKIKIYGLYVTDDFWRVKEDDDIETVNEEKYRSLNKKIGAFGINWQWLYSNKGFLSVTPYLNLNTWDMNEGPEDDKEKYGYQNNEDFTGIKSEFAFRINPKNRFIVGNDFKIVNAEYKQWAGLDTLRSGEIILPYSITFDKETTYKISNFLHYQLSPLHWCILSLGIRQDYFAYTKETRISPRFSSSFIVQENMTLNFSTGIFYQYPPFYRIFLSDINQNLKASKSNHFILGLEYLPKKDLQIKAEVYHKELSRLPVVFTDTSKVFLSQGIGYSRGIEFTITKKMSDNLYLLINYAYSTSQRKDSLSGSFYRFQYDAPHMANIMATYKLGDWWEFGLIYRYSNGFPYTPYDITTRENINNNWYCKLGDKNSKRLPDYHRLDIRVDRRFVFKSWNLSIYLDIWNLTNHQNIMRYEYSIDFTQRVPINSMFGLMPMFGLNIEF
jgi:outer membrane receptor protein involved in Fe transport